MKDEPNEFSAVRVEPPARSGQERLPDGRMLGWAEWGSVDGSPVLFSPGAATSRSLGFGAGSVHGLGIRLIAIDRPGLGVSTPDPRRTLADFARDLAAFARQRGLTRPAMVGNSQGAPFALACAAAGVVGSLAVVSGSDEVADPRFAGRLPRQLRELVDLSVSDPEAAERIFGGFAPEGMRELVLTNSPACDVAVYRQPTFAARYQLALDEAFSQGGEGYARDTVLAMGHWGIDFSAIQVPVGLWYGEHDASHSPDHGAGLAALIPGATRHIVPGIGGALLWTHAEEVLRSLR